MVAESAGFFALKLTHFNRYNWDMKPWQWLAATVAASITMMGTVSAYVYPRTEGTKLEARLDRIEKRFDNTIKRIETKIDKLIEWEMERRRQNRK